MILDYCDQQTVTVRHPKTQILFLHPRCAPKEPIGVRALAPTFLSSLFNPASKPATTPKPPLTPTPLDLKDRNEINENDNFM